MRSTVFVTVLAAALLGVAPPPPSHTVERCSKVSFGSMRVPGSPFFVGVAQRDTARADEGPVRAQVGTGHLGPPVQRSVYGQIIAVERFASDASEMLTQHGQVLVIPWDYDAACQPVYWSRSARFVPVGHRGFYDVRLRDSTYWARGIPTFDLHRPYSVPHPPPRGLAARDAASALDADALFDAHELLPYPAALDSTHWVAAEPFFAWLRADPGLEERYPLREMASSLAWMAEVAHMRQIVPTVAGTYRVTVSLGASAPDTFYMRTASRPTGSWWQYTRDRVDPPPPRWEQRAAGYELYFWHARTQEALPGHEGTRAQRGEWPLSVADTARVGADGIALRRGHFELPQVTRSIRDRPDFDAAVQVWSGAYSDRWDRGEILPDELEFREAPNGVVTFAAQYPVGDTLAFRITGERISRAELPPPW